MDIMALFAHGISSVLFAPDFYSIEVYEHER